MKKIIEYHIVENSNTFQLSKIVNKLIKNGWQPYGGVSFTGQPEGHYIQAMVKYEE